MSRLFSVLLLMRPTYPCGVYEQWFASMTMMTSRRRETLKSCVSRSCRVEEARRTALKRF